MAVFTQCSCGGKPVQNSSEFDFLLTIEKLYFYIAAALTLDCCPIYWTSKYFCIRPRTLDIHKIECKTNRPNSKEVGGQGGLWVGGAKIDKFYKKKTFFSFQWSLGLDHRVALYISIIYT